MTTALWLAEEVRKTVLVREQSWDIKGKVYKTSLFQAASSVCETRPEMIMPVFLLLVNSWNEALDWAGDVVKANG